MITVASVAEMGGACPWQLEGETSSGKSIYARYRGGMVRVYVGSIYPITENLVFKQSFGDPLDGCLNGATLAHLTAGVITWPESVVSDGEVLVP